MLNTQWKVETTEEKSGSLIVGLAFGKIHFIHETTSEKMIVSYRCLSIGLGAGAPKSIGYSESKTTDSSGGVNNVQVVQGRNFDEFQFPCRGYMLGVGASAGIIGSVLGMDITGGGLSVALFGQLPVFAGVRLWGFGRGAFPGAGFSGGLAHFWID
jgi:hypothetical protein